MQPQPQADRSTRQFVRRVWIYAALAFAMATLPQHAEASVKSEIAFHQGVVAYGKGKLDAAQTAFETVLAEDAEDTAAIHYLGLIAAEQGDFDTAIAHYQSALALDPDDTDFRFDLGSAMLEAGNISEARSEFDKVLAAEPDRARAQLFAGIGAYRAGAYRESLPYLNRAVELDEELRPQALYYTGLSQAHLQDFPAAAGAFAQVEQSPLSPLSDSARNLARQVSPSGEPARRWSLGITAGVEYDSNPTIAGRPLTKRKDGRGVYRIRASYLLYEDERYSATAGYDGYLSSHFDETFVDLMTHVGHLTTSADFDPVSFNLRYDYAYTWIDAFDTRKFRELHRVTPSVSYRESDWGFSQLYYQFHEEDFKRSLPRGTGTTLDRDGQRHVVGFNQFLFPGSYLPEFMPFTYFRIGALGDFLNADGTEFDYDSWEFSVGFGAELPGEVDLSVLYRLTDRDYQQTSIFTIPTDPHRRDDLQSRVTFELNKAFGPHWQFAIAGSFTFNDSDVPLYDYNRDIVGVYWTYRF
ncbi:MAG: tetratricopeptide repeat protein [Deltaproteobacteria bacterium]|nr:tetratricopeptide repeat protein [Deltaproteobacteria bacterium]